MQLSGLSLGFCAVVLYVTDVFVCRFLVHSLRSFAQEILCFLAVHVCLVAQRNNKTFVTRNEVGGLSLLQLRLLACRVVNGDLLVEQFSWRYVLEFLNLDVVEVLPSCKPGCVQAV